MRTIGLNYGYHIQQYSSLHTIIDTVPETFKEYPSVALKLLETLLSLDPAQRGTAATALKSEVCRFMFLANVMIV